MDRVHIIFWAFMAAGLLGVLPWFFFIVDWT